MAVILDGLTLDFVLDLWETTQEQTVEIEQFLNSEATINTGLWNRTPKTLTFTCREEHADKWTIEKSAKKHTNLTLVDADGTTTYSVWIQKITSTYAGEEHYDRPWKMEITLIILG